MQGGGEMKEIELLKKEFPESTMGRRWVENIENELTRIETINAELLKVLKRVLGKETNLLNHHILTKAIKKAEEGK